jgi:hypothetical protein
MKTKFNSNLLLLISSFLALSCEGDKLIEQRKSSAPVVVAPSPGTANFSKYVAIGSSTSAGFTDGALYPAGQSYSFPNIIAGQLALAGGGQFNQPLISSGDGFSGSTNTDGSLRGRSYINSTPGAPVSQVILFKTGSPLTTSTGSISNFGVPGARLIDAAVAGYGAANPFFGRFQSNASASILSDAVAANSSIFTFWMGDNDVLGYALNGGAAGETFNPINPSTLTSTDAFSAAIGAIFTSLSQENKPGFVLNIPPITTLPFFQVTTSLTAAGFRIVPLDAATATAFNGAYAAYNGGLQAAVTAGLLTDTERIRRTIQFVGGNNAPVITDESLTSLSALGLPSIRQADANDRYPLTAIQVIGTLQTPGNPSSVIGVGVPVPDQFTLTLSEQVNIITRTAQLNGIIAAQVASRSNLTLVDTHPLYANLFGLTATQATQLALTPAGISAADGVLGIRVGSATLVPLSLSPSSLFSSIFSSDGIHPNGQGAALVANEVIKSINQRFGATVPQAVVANYPSVRIN